MKTLNELTKLGVKQLQVKAGDKVSTNELISAGASLKDVMHRVDVVKGRVYPSIYERFHEYVYPEPNTGCWLWAGLINHQGYGSFGLNWKTKRAHRVSYELHREPIPEGFVIDHLCRNKSCVNPDHLEAVTLKENTRRGDVLIKHNLCKKCGGEVIYTKRLSSTRNTYLQRQCPACNRESANKKYKLTRAVSNADTLAILIHNEVAKLTLPDEQYEPIHNLLLELKEQLRSV